jgi:hypothetical protein
MNNHKTVQEHTEHDNDWEKNITRWKMRMAVSTSNHASYNQVMIIVDVQGTLNKHLERVENVAMKSLEDNSVILNIIESHRQTLNNMEGKTAKLMQHVSEMGNTGVKENKADVHVQNVMIVRSLPQKVMNMQKKLNRLEQNIKV